MGRAHFRRQEYFIFLIFDPLAGEDHIASVPSTQKGQKAVF